ncbi:MAG: extracellular solute-binding protein [Chloroflexi bacterium]|nr:extracellular solute-binding protein [Chloroflexota bacterium]
MLTRRDLIRASGGALALSVAGACAPSAPAGPTPAAPAPTVSGATTTLPAYVPFQGPKPDFPPSSDGIVPAGYLTFPKNLVKSSSGPAGKEGDSVSFLTYSINPTPAPVDQNPAWQQVNKDLGLSLQFTYTALQDYNVKLSTVISSGQLPDIFTMNVLGVQIPSEAEFFQSQCAELTPFLGGDAIKAYPNLANLPQTAWRNCLYAGKLYALPRVVNAVGSTMLVQLNALDDVGISQIKSTDDFSNAVKQTTRNGVYGIGGVQAPNMQWVLGMFRAPNQWREQGGKFTRDWETPEYKEAVALMRGFWDAGYVHPDTPTYVAQQGAQPFYAGKFAMYPTNFFAFGIAWDRLLGINKNFRLSALVAPGTQFQDWGGNQITVLKKGSPDRIKQVLGVLNYLAAPFGSSEHLTLTYGVEGVDFNYDPSGNPVYTDTGKNNVQYIAWQTIISPPAVLYDALDANFVKTAHPIETAAHDEAVTDASVGLYSPSNAAKGASLTQTMTDGVNQILFGRAPVDSLDQLVKDWRNNGGDTIRSEFEAEYAKNRS